MALQSLRACSASASSSSSAEQSHTHTTPVLSRLLWDATAAQLSLPPSLQCWHTLPLSIAHIHFPCSIFMLPSTLVSLFHCAEEKKVNNGELTGLPYFLLGCIFPFSALSFCEIASSPPSNPPSTKIKEGWTDSQLGNSLSSFKSKSAHLPHIALILFPFPVFNFSVSRLAVGPSVEDRSAAQGTTAYHITTHTHARITEEIKTKL